MPTFVRLFACLSTILVLQGCAEAQLDPFGRPYSGDYNYPPGRRVCHDPDVEVQPEFVRGNHPAMPVLNGYDARNAQATVKYRVDAAGAVKVLSVEGSDKAYGNHAAIAVRDWKFKPATRDGVAVAAKCEFTFKSVFYGFEDEEPGKANQ